MDTGFHEETIEDESGDEMDEAQVLQVLGYDSESFVSKICIQAKVCYPNVRHNRKGKRRATNNRSEREDSAQSTSHGS